MIQKKTIRELCQIIGGNPSPKENEFSKEGIPFVKMMDLGRYHLTNNLIKVDNKISQDYPKIKSLKTIPKGSILLPRSGSVGLNHRAILGIDAFIVSHICALSIIDNHIIHNKYLYYYLTSIDMVSITKQTTGLDAITFEDLGKINIPLPHLETQKKIAVILDKADELRQNDRKIHEKYDQLAQIVFQEMFGNQSNDFKDFRKARLIEVILEGPQNGLYKPSKSYGKGTPIIRIDSFNNSTVNIKKLKRVDLDENEIGRYEIKESEFLINRVNSMSHLGKCGLVPKINERTVFESNMMRIKFDPKKVSNFYMLYILSSQFIKNQVIKCSKDAVNQSSINQNDVNSFTIPVPPIELQKKFNRIIENIEIQKQLIQISLHKSEELFQSLLQRAFRGELV
jgi:type I restriction enzyme S subunit